jgi:hypothetical protein
MYILTSLLQVPDGLMAAYESQSEEEEMDEMCETLVQSLAAYSLCIMATLLQAPDGVMAVYQILSEEEEMDKI